MLQNLPEFIKICQFVLGYRCNNRCSHCFISASPDSSINIKPSFAYHIAKEISQIPSIKEIHFNGGEPFLYIDTINNILNFSNKYGNKIVKISTSAHEFNTYDLGQSIIKSIASNIDTLFISIDKYHLENTDIENYKILDLLCKKHNIRSIYSVCYQNIFDYTAIVNLISSNNFKVDDLFRQPIAEYGMAKVTKQFTPKELSKNICPEYKCPEFNVITIMPDNYITTCSAYSGRLNLIKTYKSINALKHCINSENISDEFYYLRINNSLQQIQAFYGITEQELDVSTPCSTCKSILENIRSNK